MVKVAKFGGSSLCSAEQFQKAIHIIQEDPDRRYVVPSAPGKRFDGDTKVTDLLYHCHAQAAAGENFEVTLEEIHSRFQEIINHLGLDLSLEEEFNIIRKKLAAGVRVDYVASRGEYLNGIVMANCLGIPFLDAAEVIRFDENGEFLENETDNILHARLKELERAVIPGFYGAGPDGEVITFSRGGSDITGSIVARACRADLYENWTDVSGFMMVDPHLVENPAIIDTITYRELRELSYMGASVLHEEAIFPVRAMGIPINIRNTNSPADKGTMIVSHTCTVPPCAITGIAGKKGFCAIHLEKDLMNNEVGYCRKVLNALELEGLPFEHMPSGIDTMTIFVHQSLFQAREQQVISHIRRLADPDVLELDTDMALIAVVGRGMRQTTGCAAKIFSALAKENINIRMIDQGSSELNIIVGVRSENFEQAVRAIYMTFTQPENKT